MANRLTKITTRTGDDGHSGLADGQRYAKSDLVFEVMGDIDELNSMIGFLRSLWKTSETDKISNQKNLFFMEIDLIWHKIQHHLFDFGGELSMPGYCFITENHVLFLDELINKYNGELPRLQEFILPMGNQQITTTHLVRTITRRCERHLVALQFAQLLQSSQENNVEQPNKNTLHYLNRLSDWSFICARILAKHHGEAEFYWEKQFTIV
jgi:cob(I)alamin adenosyltransferase